MSSSSGLRGCGALSALLGSGGGGGWTPPARLRSVPPRILRGAAVETGAGAARAMSAAAEERPEKGPSVTSELASGDPGVDSAACCPICGRSLPESDNAALNRHIDSCLTAEPQTGQPKTQMTLNFSTRRPGAEKKLQSPASNASLAPSKATKGAKQVKRTPSLPPPTSRNMSRKVPRVPPEFHGWMTAQTAIVGRRFHKAAPAPYEGEILHLLREPHNPWDMNAIQVAEQTSHLLQTGEDATTSVSHIPHTSLSHLNRGGQGWGNRMGTGLQATPSIFMHASQTMGVKGGVHNSGEGFPHIVTVALSGTLLMFSNYGQLYEGHVVRQLEYSDQDEVLGYLPARVAAHLAGPLDAHHVDAKLVASAPAEGTSASAPVPVLLAMCRWRCETEEKESGTSANDFDIISLKASIVEAMAEANAKDGEAGLVPTSLRQNMKLIIETVLDMKNNCLSDGEILLLKDFLKLSLAAQCLFLRLYLRKGPVFKASSLEYPEVPDTSAAIGSLANCYFLHVVDEHGNGADAIDTSLVLGALTVQEMQEALAMLGLPTNGSRSDVVYRLCAQAAHPEIVRGMMHPELAGSAQGTSTNSVAGVSRRWWESVVASARGPLIALNPEAVLCFARANRLFFQNEGQDVQSFLLVDLGALKYPEYKLPASELRKPLFTCRDDMVEYEKALDSAAALSRAVKANDLIAAENELQPAWEALWSGQHKSCAGFDTSLEAPLPPQGRFRAGWVYASMCTVGVSLLEKRRRYAEAAEALRVLLGGICCPGRRGEWWTRLSIDLEHLGKQDEALEAAEAALADDWVRSGDRTALQRRVLRLGKPPRRWRTPSWATLSCSALWEPSEIVIEGRPTQRVIGMKSAFWGYDGDQTSVEGLVLQHQAMDENGGWKGIHAEGGIWATLFSLLLWEVLFDPTVEGAFVHAFHNAPLDLGTESFWPARHKAIEAILDRIVRGDGPSMLQARWEMSCGTRCLGVNWERTSLPELMEIAECIGGSGLAAVCRLKAQDFSNWSSGLPDLLLWRPHHKDAKLVEVKGPRDRLSEQQRSWCCALLEAGLKVEVYRIREPKTLKKRKQESPP